MLLCEKQRYIFFLWLGFFSIILKSPPNFHIRFYRMTILSYAFAPLAPPSPILLWMQMADPSIPLTITEWEVSHFFVIPLGYRRLTIGGIAQTRSHNSITPRCI